MTRRASPTLIGGFVVGAVVVALIGLILIGGGDLFHRKHPFVLYFRGKVDGLDVGAPVKFQGVLVGSVTSIRLRLSEEGPSTTIPVTIVLDEDLIESRSGYDVTFEPSRMQRIVERGLRARLDIESFVTGNRYVALEMAPDTPLRLFGGESELQEIPTLPTPLEEVQRIVERLSEMDLEGMVADLIETSRALRELVASSEARSIPAALVRTLGTIDEAAGALRAQIDPLAGSVTTMSHAVEGAAGALEKTLEDLRPTIAGLDLAARRAVEVEEEVSRTLAAARGIFDPEAPLVVRLQETLAELASASRSLRGLTELLERDPSSLLRGRDVPSKP